MQLVLIHPQQMPERLRTGLHAALAVFRREDIYPLAAWRALAAEHVAQDLGLDDGISDEHRRALAVLVLAEEAANVALGLPVDGDERAVLDFEG